MTASIQRFLDGLTVASVATTLVDVALVYYLIYRLLLTIRGTRAAQMIVGKRARKREEVDVQIEQRTRSEGREAVEGGDA